ncbi:MAG TPA: carotenoid oxygenase family protein [Gammaproteobacteria bacterium]
MTTPFPDTMDFAGFNQPLRIECDIYDLVVEGEIPAEIRGRWYRETPDPQYPPMLGRDTYLSGDGMVSMFTFEDGHVDYKSRYVMTERLKNERAARRSLYGLYRNPFTDDPSVQGKPGRSTANTTPVHHAGKLLATKEDGRPIELDPDTLETLGEYDFGGRLESRTMTAHPRIDYDTGEMLFFGYEAGGLASRDVAFCVADRAGRLVRESWFEAPYVGLVHDFAVTEEHVIFPFQPVTADEARLRAGGPHWVWEPEKGTVVGIMPREGGVDEIRWFRGPARSFFHFMNAHTEGDLVHLDFGVLDEIMFPFIREASGLEGPFVPGEHSGLVRWTFDLGGATDTWRETRLGPGGDFPIVARKDHMKAYAIGYYQLFDPEKGPPRLAGPVGAGFNTIVRIDLRTGELRTFSPGPAHTVQEHVHVPSRVPDHEGYLVFAVDFHETMSSEIFLLEAEHPERGPIARIKMPMRLRNQVHGTWVPAEELRRASAP